ncbi:MAG: hypothetical protein R2795_09035 [Saprospiraceae bacterium]
MVWKDSTVYYWRIAPDSATTNDQPLWEKSSFTFINGITSGWGQGHWGQWEEGTFDDIMINDEKQFVFGQSAFNVRIKNNLWSATDRPGLSYNFDNLAGSVVPWNYLHEGIGVVVYPPNNPSGFWRNPPGPNTFNAGDYGVPTGGRGYLLFLPLPLKSVKT